jgi:hypothetical protein
MPHSELRRLFIQNCEDIVRNQNDVTIDHDALARFAGTLKKSNFVPDWKEYISAEAHQFENYDIGRAFYELAIIVANQGGFIYEDADGQMKKWNVNGSGARAMVEKMAEIRGAGALPFYQVAPEDVDAKIGPLLAGVPFAEKRLEIFKEFADPARQAEAMRLLQGCKTADGTYAFDMDMAGALTHLFPAGFGDDPMMKKAILTLLMVSGNAHHHGISCDVSDLTVAADYVLPQVLNADHIGVLKFSEPLTKKLELKEAFNESAAEVSALRAAAIVVSEKLSELTGLSAQDVDGNLWMAGRKLQNARPHMMCKTMWF